MSATNINLNVNPIELDFELDSSNNRTDEINVNELVEDAAWGFCVEDDEVLQSTQNNYDSHLNHFSSSFPAPEKQADILAHSDITCMTVEKEEDLLITGHKMGAVVLWKISSGEFLVKLQLEKDNHNKKITGVAFSKHNQKIITTSEDEEPLNAATGSGKIERGYNVIIWNYYQDLPSLKDPTKLLFNGLKCDSISCLFVTKTKDYNYAIFASKKEDKKIYVWEFMENKPPMYFKTKHTDLILSLGILLPEETTVKNANFTILSVGWDKRFFEYELKQKESVDLDGNKQNIFSVSARYFDSVSHVKSITCLLIHFPYDVARRYNNTANNDILNVAPILLTGSLDCSVIIWDYETGTKVRQLKGHKDQVTAIKVCDRDDDGNPPIVFSSSFDKTIILWDLVTGEKIRILEHTAKLLSLEIYDSPEGIILFSADEKNALIWDLRKTKRTHVLNSEKGVTVIDTYQDRSTKETKVLVGCVDNKWKIYDFDVRERKQTSAVGAETATVREHLRQNSRAGIYKSLKDFPHHKNRINTGVIYADEAHNRDIVISGDGDGKIVVWNLTNLKPLSEYPKADQFVVLSVALYDPNLYGRERKLDQFRQNPDTVFDASNLHLAKPFVLTGGADKTIQVFDFLETATTEVLSETGNNSAQTVAKLPITKKIKDVPSGHGNNIRSLVIHHPVSSKEAPLFISGSYDKRAFLWDLRTLTKLRIFDEGFHSNFVFFTAIYDPAIQFGVKNNKTNVDQTVPAVITSSYDGKVGIWNMFSELDQIVDLENFLEKPEPIKDGSLPKLRRSFQAHKESVTALAVFTPRDTETHPLIITGSIDRLVIIWDFITLEKIHTLVGHTDRVCWVKIYDPIGLRHPILFSGGDDGQTIVWKDSLYSKSFMPLQEVVRNAFVLDCQTTDWPLITEFAQKYHPLFFAENSNLFMLAVSYGRPDFLIKFWESLVVTLPTIKPASFINQNSLPSENPSMFSGYSFSSPRLMKQKPQTVTWINKVLQNFDFYDKTAFAKLRQWISFERLKPAVLNAKVNNTIAVNSGRKIQKKRQEKDDDDSDDVTKELVKDKVDLKGYIRMKENHNPSEIGQENICQADILKLAISKCDLLAVRVIVLAWIKNLNKDMDSILTQRYYHPMYYLPMRTVNYLYFYYPSEFVFFIRNLKLIRNHPSLMEGSQEKDLTIVNRMEMKGSGESLNYYSEFWNPKEARKRTILERALEIVERSDDEAANQVSSCVVKFRIGYYLLTVLDLFVDNFLKVIYLFYAKSIPAQPVTSVMIPFRTNKYLIHYLQWYVDVSNQLNDVEIFKAEVPIVMLNYFWQIYGRHAHVIAFMKYLIFFFLFLVYAYAFQPSNAYHLWIILLTFTNIGFFVYYGYEEFAQILQMQKQFDLKPLLKHFYDPWNVIDLVIVVTGLMGSSLRLCCGVDTTVGRSLLAVTSVSMWFKILYFLRPFSSTGPLVAMIVQIVLSVRMFLFVLFCLIAGFAQAFWLLSNEEPDAHFGTVARAFLNSFLYTVGQNIDPMFKGLDSARKPAIFLLVIFLILMMIIMLNLLVALMGDVFTNIRAKGEALWRKEQAAIVLEQEFLYEKLGIQKYLLVLKYSAEVTNPVIKYDEYLKTYTESSDAKRVELFNPVDNNPAVDNNPINSMSSKSFDNTSPRRAKTVENNLSHSNSSNSKKPVGNSDSPVKSNPTDTNSVNNNLVSNNTHQQPSAATLNNPVMVNPPDNNSTQNNPVDHNPIASMFSTTFNTMAGWFSGKK